MTQKEAFDILQLGHNVLLTGPAGSGKTFLLNKYIEHLKKNKISVGITASTGIAATHINGRTIHSFTGIGIKNKLTPKDLQKIQKHSYLQEQLSKTQILIIDEVSMLNSYILDMVDQVCRTFKEPFKPFGGIQVLLCGDFFQLPPVLKNRKEVEFIVSSYSWQDMNIKVCYLTEQHRHKDSVLSKILNEIRANKVSNTSRQYLRNRYKKGVVGGIVPTKLYTHNLDVDLINNHELSKIDEKSYEYYMVSKGNKKAVKALKDSCLAPEELVLKKGAAVMFVKNNFGKGYVNGTLGTVVDFDDENCPVVKTANGDNITARPVRWQIEEGEEKETWIQQVPLRLAWAITVHKSQGMSLDAAEIDLSKTFEYGMGYVALSRIRTLDGLRLMGLNHLALQVSDRALKLDVEFQKMSQDVFKSLNRLSYKQKRKMQKEFIKKVKSSNQKG